MIIQHLDKRFYFSKKLYNDLKIYCKHMIYNNEDILILMDGPEGSGKSTFARQISVAISYILKHEFNSECSTEIKSLQWTLDGYIKHSLMGQKYQINILDESRRLLNRKNFNNKETRNFSDYLSECRKYNQVHFILLPAYHDIDKYILLWRAKMFIHCLKYIDEQGELIKGQFKNYPIDDRLIYMWEEGRYRYPKFNPVKFGGYIDKFPDFEAFDDMEKYEELQRKHSIKKYGIKKEVDREKQLLKKAVEVVGADKASLIFEIGRSTVYRRLESNIEIPV